jgi:hypothetical protein
LDFVNILEEKKICDIACFSQICSSAWHMALNDVSPVVSNHWEIMTMILMLAVIGIFLVAVS